MNKANQGLYILALIIAVFLQVLSVAAIIALVALLGLGVKYLIESIYFRGKKFKQLKESLSEEVRKSNELNAYVAELKSRLVDYHTQDYGSATYSDSSLFNYSRPWLSQLHNNTPNEHFCSLTVCKSAQNQPLKYLCKYFGIVCDEPTLDFFETLLNDFAAAEEGKSILVLERNDVLVKYKELIPWFVRKFGKKRLFKKLGFQKIDMSDAYFPRYSFIYVSPGGNSKMTCDIVLDCANLEKLIEFINAKIETSKTIRYQRALMTERLRTAIKARDNYTCQMCGISLKDEPHLLLEIDHIIPLSKNGRTTVDNLQTLCWCCNRKKGARLLDVVQ